MDYPRLVTAELPDQRRMWYLIDSQFDFLPEAKAFLDWKAATRCAPTTLQVYASRLLWYYRFLAQRGRSVEDATPEDLTEFVIWLCNPYRAVGNMAALYTPSPLQASSVNGILQVVGALYRFLVRRGQLTSSPVLFVEVPKSKWLRERDLLAHTRTGSHAQTVQRLELKLKEPRTQPQVISETDFHTFLQSIHISREPNGDPSGFRDRLLCLLLKEGGFRLGELLGMHLEDLEFGRHGVHVRFRSTNENGARAKAGYGKDRFVHLPADVMGLLDLYLTDVWVTANPHTDHLWIVLKPEARDQAGRSTFGTALTGQAVEKTFQHYSKKSGVSIHPHLLRHTHATELVLSYLYKKEPVDWKYVQERLGHASVVTTMEIYVHLTNEDRKEAYEQYLARKRERHAHQ
jgi:integrase/recombinase XerD